MGLDGPLTVPFSSKGKCGVYFFLNKKKCSNHRKKAKNKCTVPFHPYNLKNIFDLMAEKGQIINY